MRKKSLALSIIFLLAVLFIAPTPSSADSFCAGWHDGFIAGYCYQNDFCLEPLVPLCPLPNINEDSYQDGYGRGFLAGLSARK